MMSAPAAGPRVCSRHRRVLLALMASVASVGLSTHAARSQALTPDMLNPFPGALTTEQDRVLRPVDPNARPGVRNNLSPPVRSSSTGIFDGDIVRGTSDIAFDALNRKKPARKRYPGEKPPLTQEQLSRIDPNVRAPRLATSPTYGANRERVAPAITGSVPGQPARRRLPIDYDPFGPVGFRVGSFLVKSAVEIGGGFDTNPGRFATQRGSSFYRIAPELLAATNWSRHAIVVDLRGSYTGYGRTFPPAAGEVNFVPVEIDRIEFTGRVDGRLDVTRDTRVNGALRLGVGQDNPGSPNLTAGLQRYPLYSSVGTTVGVEQDFNRLRLRLDGTADNITFQSSRLTDGTLANNNDRDYSQYGGIGRVSYEVLPGLRPFGEIQGDTRSHEVKIDRSGYLRDSIGGYIKAGTTFELARIVTGEVALGYTSRQYTDARLANLKGILTSASLVWTASPLTTVSLLADTRVDETTLPGVPGVLTRTYTMAVNHDFRRWLTAIGRFTYGTQDYQENPRYDQIYSLSADLIYRLNRDMQIKAQVRHDRLESNIPTASTQSTTMTVGIRLQR